MFFKSNGGEASGFNLGFAESRGDVICFLDSDDVFLPYQGAEGG
jgi:glycosyltransferase involved in cell wall biosynthesis